MEPPRPLPPSPDQTPPRARTGTPRWRELVGPALFEASFVVLGVVLALAANEWREARLHRSEATAARAAIAAELKANRELVRSSMQYHRSLFDSLRRRSPTDSAPGPMFFRRGFVNPAQLSSTAWDVASQTGVLQHVPYQEVLAISHAYGLQRRYDAMGQSTGELIYAELYRVGPNGVSSNWRNLSAILAALAYREDLLVRAIDSTMTLLEPAAPRPR